MEEARLTVQRFLQELWSVYRSVTYSDLLIRGMLSLHLIFIIACVQEKRKAVCTRASLLKLPLMTSILAVIFRPLRELLQFMQPLYLRTHMASQPYFDDDRVMIALWVIPNLVLTLVFLLVVAFHSDAVPLPNLLANEPGNANGETLLPRPLASAEPSDPAAPADPSPEAKT